MGILWVPPRKMELSDREIDGGREQRSESRSRSQFYDNGKSCGGKVFSNLGVPMSHLPLIYSELITTKAKTPSLRGGWNPTKAISFPFHKQRIDYEIASPLGGSQ